jgi:hypothetical protein
MEKKRIGKKQWYQGFEPHGPKVLTLTTKLKIGFNLLDAFNFFTLSFPRAYVSPPRQLTGCPHFPQKKCGRGGSNPHL